MSLFSNQKDRKYALLGLRIAGDFGATIAFPLIFFVIIGQWMDDKYGRDALFTIIAFVISAILSGIMIYKKAKRYGKEYQSIDEIK
jgi:hypothetical protein